MESYNSKCSIKNLVDRLLLHTDDEINEAFKEIPANKLGQLAFHIFVAEQDNLESGDENEYN